MGLEWSASKLSTTFDSGGERLRAGVTPEQKGKEEDGSEICLVDRLMYRLILSEGDFIKGDIATYPSITS